MGIEIKAVTLEHRILPVTINSDGSADVTVTKGYDDAEKFVVIESFNVPLSAAEVLIILGPVQYPELSLRDNIMKSVYIFLMQNGKLN